MKTIVKTVTATDEEQPLWWSPAGNLVWKPRTSTEEVLRLSTGTSYKKASGHIQIHKEDRTRWNITWFIYTKTSSVSGHVSLTNAELLTAFGLWCEEYKFLNDELLCGKHTAEYGVSGQFIRQGIYLNIPCPKAELFGDPNFSLKLTPHVLDEVKKFVEKHL